MNYTYIDLFPDPVAELEKEGAKGCKSAAEASSNTNITITMVQDGPQAESAILGENGVSDGASKGHLVVIEFYCAWCISKDWSWMHRKGINFLDAPVSGGEPFAIFWRISNNGWWISR